MLIALGGENSLSNSLVRSGRDRPTVVLADILGPAIRAPIDDLSSLAENLILLRYIELRSQLYRLISLMKVRDSDFDPSLREFTIDFNGLAIRDTPATAEAILSSLASNGEQVRALAWLEAAPTQRDGD